MVEEREGIRCVLAFGKDIPTAKASVGDDVTFVTLCNPMPTGDHWKIIDWVRDHMKRGPSSLARVPNVRRDFIKRASAALSVGPKQGFCMELGSMAARRFRDDNGLRMQRGKVYAFINLQPETVEQTTEPTKLDLGLPEDWLDHTPDRGPQ